MILECDSEHIAFATQQPLQLISSFDTEEIWISTVSYNVYSYVKGILVASRTSCSGIHATPPASRCQYPASKRISRISRVLKTIGNEMKIKNDRIELQETRTRSHTKPYETRSATR